MAGPSQPRSLSFYLAVLVTLALLPLGVIALFQTRNVISDAEELARNSLLSRTFAAAAEERELLQKAVGASAGVAAFVPEIATDPDACSALLRRFVAGKPEFVFAGFIEASGWMRCSSNGEAQDFSDAPGFDGIVANPTLTFSVSRSGLVTGQPVIIVTQPVWDADKLAGFVSLSIPNALTRTLPEDLDLTTDVLIAIFDSDGELLASNTALEQARDYLPPEAEQRLVMDWDGQTFTSRTPLGEKRVFAVTSLIPGEVFVVGSWPRTAALASIGSKNASLTLAFPILMWIAGLGFALWGLDRVVIRHMHTVRSALRRFALGDRTLIPTLRDAPEEFQYLRTAFNRMALLVGEAEARTEKDLQEKTILLREVHHRVKNNLQLVASIMNMHARTANTPEARRLLGQLQRRVRGLAMVHQTLNDDSLMTTISSRSLTDRLVSELAQPAPINGQHVEVRTEAVSVELGQDQSVAFSMLLSEALMNATKYVGIPEDGPPSITVMLAENGPGELILSVRNTRGEMGADKDDAIMTSGGVGSGLMRAFVAQIGGTETVTETTDLYDYSVRFQRTDDDATSIPRDLPEDRPTHGAKAAE